MHPRRQQLLKTGEQHGEGPLVFPFSQAQRTGPLFHRFDALKSSIQHSLSVRVMTIAQSKKRYRFLFWSAALECAGKRLWFKTMPALCKGVDLPLRVSPVVDGAKGAIDGVWPSVHLLFPPCPGNPLCYSTGQKQKRLVAPHLGRSPASDLDDQC